MNNDGCIQRLCQARAKVQPYSYTDTALIYAIDALQENDKLKEENNNYYYELMGVMHFVDKWLNEEELKEENAVRRADRMREKTLCIVEDLEKELAELKEKQVAKKPLEDFVLDENPITLKTFDRKIYVCPSCDNIYLQQNQQNIGRAHV